MNENNYTHIKKRVLYKCWGFVLKVEMILPRNHWVERVMTRLNPNFNTKITTQTCTIQKGYEICQQISPLHSFSQNCRLRNFYICKMFYGLVPEQQLSRALFLF